MSYSDRFGAVGTRRVAWRRGRTSLVVLCGFAAGLWYSPVAAENCLEQVRGLASEYNLTIDPPDAEGEASVDSRSTGETGETGATGEMGRTGGLIEPPQGSSEMLIEPPAPPANGMQTLPGPTDRPLRETPAPPGSLDTSELVVLETVLIAARAEAQHGSEAGCYERLHEAQAIILGRE